MPSIPTHDLPERAREVYRAFASRDRAAIDRILTDDFSFSSPVDVGLDRAGYFKTEVLTFRGDKLCGAEVYFGWNVE